MDKSSITDSQLRVWKACMESQDHVFCTGEGGTGKSWLLRKITEKLRDDESRGGKRVAVTSSTGISAFSVQGITLHGFAGVQTIENDVTEMLKRASRGRSYSNWVDTSILIVDEISMISATFFDNLSYIARQIRGSEKPFGGIRLIMFGDFLQLPPVSRGSSRVKKVFESLSWQKMLVRCFVLSDIIRQSDAELKRALSLIRVGKCNDGVERFILSLSRDLQYSDNIEPVNLFSLRRNTEEYNSTRLDRLNSSAHTYESVDCGDAFMLKHCIAPKSLTLKTGAQVMVNHNVSESIVNGSIGIITGFEYYQQSKTFYPIVSLRCANGAMTTFVPEPCRWETVGPRNTVISRRIQIPLMLAWALTIHKSQGQTIPRLKVNLDGVFEYGQTYVALSRAVDSENLQVTNFSKGKVKADLESIVFYSTLSFEQSEDSDIIQGKIVENTSGTKVYVGFGD